MKAPKEAVRHDEVPCVDCGRKVRVVVAWRHADGKIEVKRPVDVRCFDCGCRKFVPEARS